MKGLKEKLGFLIFFERKSKQKTLDVKICVHNMNIIPFVKRKSVLKNEELLEESVLVSRKAF